MQNLTLFLPAILAINLALSGIKNGLEAIKDKTATKLDDTAFAWVTSAVGFLSKVVDLFSANTKH